MNNSQAGHRWIISWLDDSGDPDHDIRETANTAQQARDTIARLLNGYFWTPEEADEIGGDLTEPAYLALVRDQFGGDIISGLLHLPGDAIEFVCDNGSLIIQYEF